MTAKRAWRAGGRACVRACSRHAPLLRMTVKPRLYCAVPLGHVNDSMGNSGVGPLFFFSSSSFSFLLSLASSSALFLASFLSPPAARLRGQRDCSIMYYCALFGTLSWEILRTMGLEPSLARAAVTTSRSGLVPAGTGTGMGTGTGATTGLLGKSGAMRIDWYCLLVFDTCRMVHVGT